MTVHYEIHPAIGVARLGSSRDPTEEGFFYGPEPGVAPPRRYRDPTGNLKRQAARFRVFRCDRNEAGEVLRADELASHEARVSWAVHLANRKGVARRSLSGPGRRNGATGNDASDSDLIVNPGPRTIHGPGEIQTFDTGRFRSTVVPLGEMVMEADGRLRVLGGFGQSGSDPAQPRLDFRTGHFVDNSGWFDDTSDGSVTARITLADGTIHHATAWVVVGPPDFAPGIMNLVTLYDLLFDRAVRRGVLRGPTETPEGVSFRRHIQPILQRILGYGWVNRYAHSGFKDEGKAHGPGRDGDYSSMWDILADPSPDAREKRSRLFGHLRNPDPRGVQPAIHASKLMPRLNEAVRGRSGPGNVLCLTPTQYSTMQAWAEGDFVDDRQSKAQCRESLPDALDRMALEACVGGALFPGIEVSHFVFCDDANFMPGEPFRLRHERVRPGDVTQQNGVPWQADFHICRWEDREGPLLKRMGWWPAQRPDDVFTQTGPSAMVPWARGLGPDYQDMVDKWDRLGFVVDRGTPDVPFYVEDERDVRSLGP